VTDIVVSRERFDDLLVSCTIFDHAGVVTDEAIAKLQVDISDAIDEQVILGARTINAQLYQYDKSSAARLLTVTATPTITVTLGSTPAAQDGPTRSLPVLATETPVPIITPTWTPMMDATPELAVTETVEPAATESATPTPADTVQPEVTATWTPAPFNTAEPGIPQTETPVATDTDFPGATETFTPLPPVTAGP
jgi:hypothetical protein